MKGFLQLNLLNLALLFLLALMGLNTWLIYLNHKEVKSTHVVINDAAKIIKAIEALYGDAVKNIELGIRGYALLKQENMLQPYKDGLAVFDGNFFLVDTLLQKYQFDRTDLVALKQEFDDYRRHSIQMVDHLKRDSLAAFRRGLAAEKERDLWLPFAAFSKKYSKLSSDLRIDATHQFEAAQSRSLWLQIGLSILAIPLLGLVAWRIYHNRQQQQKLMLGFDQSIRQLFFNDGRPTAQLNSQTIFHRLTEALGSASGFVGQMAQRDFTATWAGLNEQNQALNTTNLTGQLLTMRNQLQQVEEREQRQTWTALGLAKFADIFRSEAQDLAKLSNLIISNLVKYIETNQGGLFVANTDETGQPVLDLYASYAYGEARTEARRLQPGESLVGQAFLDRQTIYLDNLPADYSPIASGLGKASPRCSLIVPLKFNEQVYGVVEVASFNDIALHQRAFVEKLSENLAATIASAQSAERNLRMLQEAQTLTEQLRTQEEGMRQNVEELMATQEEMARKQSDLVSSQEKLQASETILKKAYERMQAQQAEVLKQKQEADEMNQQLRSQEEELRQNMEELAASFEEMARKQTELETSEQRLKSNEHILKKAYDKMQAQNVEMKQKKEEAEQMTQELMAQEEEMRQNLEEMHAVQDEIARKNADLETKQRRMESQDAIMKKAYEKLNSQKQKYDQEIGILKQQLAEKDQQIAHSSPPNGHARSPIA
jgi:GAF domain/CHASE3 domain